MNRTELSFRGGHPTLGNLNITKGYMSFLCLHMHLCAYVYACTYVYMCVCTCARSCVCTHVCVCGGQGSMSKVFLSLSTLFFETVCHWSWRSLIIKAGRLAGPQDLPVSGLCLQHWGYRCGLHTQHWTGYWGPKSGSSCLCSKCFVCWVISPVLTYTFLPYTSHWRCFTLDLSQRAEEREIENVLNVPLCWKRSLRPTGVWWQCLDAQVCFISNYFASSET